MGKALSEMTMEELWQLFPIILTGHNPDYMRWYEEQRNEILKALDSRMIKRISHIGSTAVPGLLAKPTVDILLEIAGDQNTAEVKDKLIGSGWVLMSHKEKPYLQMSYNKGYTSEGFAEKVYHLHVRCYGDWDELYFRDYLIEHKDAAAEYAALKESLLEEYRNNRDGYTEAKSEFVKRYSDQAREYYGRRYLPVQEP